ncbi:2-amino-4-hydroxy-6-hydroxymethyldihydropteridine diphosphokinase [Coralloluteibacterium thermophilus]|uniref:2-amino-4-hydroxy-6-hydroxymethyldihydropteridine pyrophosphokinase n=1 Tax=Coralloluteibacterium thermophilum TaxID=2707049 RepID=A0ABV9NJZ7_9GAMM
MRAHVGLGGNLGDVAASFDSALHMLDTLADTRVAAVSRRYRTPPWGETAQPPFLNAVAALDTALAPEALLDALLDIERAHGRDRGADALRWGPRTLDLDLLTYGERSIDTPRLTLPHPRIHQRAFVLVPLAEVAPGLLLPGQGRVEALRDALGQDGIVAVEAGAPLASSPSATGP